MENKTIVSAAILALSMFAGSASAQELTVGEIQAMKNQAAILKNQEAVEALRLKLAAEAAPKEKDEKPKVDHFSSSPLGLPMAPLPEVGDSYHALLIRGTGNDRVAILVNNDGQEVLVRKGSRLKDGSVIESLEDQSIKVRTPGKSKKGGKISTIRLGTANFSNQSDATKASPLPMMPPAPFIPPQPMTPAMPGEARR